MDPADTEIIEADIPLDISVPLERQDSRRTFQRALALIANELPDDDGANEAI